MPVTQAMLMAAGLGTRLEPFTRACPKALIPVLGVPIAQFALDGLIEAGVERVVANVHHLPERSREGLLELDRGGMDLLLSDETAQLLGSAGGIRKALPLLGDRFFIVNADVLSDCPWLSLAKEHEKLRALFGAELTLAIIDRPPAGGKYRELYLDPLTRKVVGFSPETRPDRPFWIGSAVVEKSALAHVPASGPAEFVPAILEPMIQAGKVGFMLMDGIWRDVGTPELWHETHLFLLSALETGALPRSWLQRLGSRNTRVADRIWCSRESEKSARRAFNPDGWGAPSYFSSDRELERFGPSAVLYGDPATNIPAGGIGYASHWIRVSRSTSS